MRILALDHSLCNTGVCYVEDDNVNTISLYQRKYSKDCRTDVWYTMFKMAVDLIKLYNPELILLEAPNFVRSAGAAASYNSVYALGGLFTLHGIHVDYIGAQRCRKAVGCANGTGKLPVLYTVYNMYPSLPWIKNKQGVVTKAYNEHMADAVAVYIAYTKQRGD